MPSPLEEQLFRRWEPTIATVVRNYPSYVILNTDGSSSYARQQFKWALDAFCSSSWQSEIPREIAELVRREFVFSDNGPGQVYIGPRRTKKKDLRVAIDTPGFTPSAEPLTISCSDPITQAAIFHLKNLDLLPFPINLTDLSTDPALLSAAYPNTILTPLDQPGHFTLI